MILAIETSTPRASLALWDPACEAILFGAEFVSNRAHNAMIFDPLSKALAALGDRDLSAVVIGSGPGSYGGVRVSIAVAVALSLARRCVAVGMPSIAALARDALIVADARRKSFYTWQIRDHQPVGQPSLCDATELRAQVESSELPVLTPDADPPLDLDIRPAIPRAAELGRLYHRLNAASQSALAAQPLEPIYIRPPFITTAKS